MVFQREFLGCDRPALHTAAKWLLERYQTADLVDLSHVTIVLNSRRAGRRLREVLLEVADGDQLRLFPPQVVMVGALPELLYDQKNPFASPLVQQLAWSGALQTVDRAMVRRAIAQLPRQADDPRWWELAGLLRRQHRELAGHRLDFAAVARLGKQVEGFNEGPRWHALARIQQRYLRTLDELGLWDRQTARNYAVDHQECRFHGDLILLGVVDLTMTLRAMLRQLDGHVRLWVNAPATWEQRFDGLGCVDPEAWRAARLDVADGQILLADGPANQADAVLHAIDRWGGKYGADEVTVGVPDASLLPFLRNRCEQAGLRTRWGPGRGMNASRLVQWLRVVADYLSQDRIAHLAELARQVDTQDFLYRSGCRDDVATALDQYIQRHLPHRVPRGRTAPGEVPRAIDALRRLLEPLTGPSRPVADWVAPLQDVLLQVFGQRDLDPKREADQAIMQTWDQLHIAMEGIQALPSALAPRVTASQAILMILAQLQDDELTPPHDPRAIEMVGWLELPLDDAPAVIVTSMNDGVVPGAVTSDLFLPNRLREALQLDDNARRYARDAYALRTLLESRESVTLIVGRRDALGEPLRPSRLLLAEAAERVAPRCLRLFSDATDCPTPAPAATAEDSQLVVPMPPPLSQPIPSLSVSDFGRYLSCPYRFYLYKVAKLRSVDDSADELDAPSFGNLAHDVVQDFALGPCRDSDDADEIRLFLNERLSDRVRQVYGRPAKPAVQVQVGQLRVRLAALADRQAAWRREGWRITRFIESEPPGGGVPLMVDGEAIQLTGRIDRIDYHPERGQYAVLDYKTGEAGDTPEKKHLRGRKAKDPITPESWTDLQLPLYRYITRALGLEGEIRLGYILLPSDPAATKFHLADWSPDDLREADEAARNVVRCIRQEIFWPPTDPSPYPRDDFGPICQAGVFGREFEEAVAP